MRNRYIRFCTCLVFATVSAISSLAQSSEHVRSEQLLQLKVDGLDPTRLTANLEVPAMMGGVSDGSELPDAPSSAQPATSGASPTASPVVRRESRGAAPAAMGGPLGVDGRVADKMYLAVTGAMFSASIANAELTLNCLKQHASCNDVPSVFQSRVALYGIGIPADFAVAYLTYYMKAKHSRIWYVPAAAVTAANVVFGVRAYRWAQR